MADELLQIAHVDVLRDLKGKFWAHTESYILKPHYISDQLLDTRNDPQNNKTT